VGLGRRGGTRRWGCDLGDDGEESGMEVVPSRGRMVLRDLGNACVSRGLAGSALFSVDQDIDQDFLCLKIFYPHRYVARTQNTLCSFPFASCKDQFELHFQL